MLMSDHHDITRRSSKLVLETIHDNSNSGAHPSLPQLDFNVAEGGGGWRGGSKIKKFNKKT